MSRGGDERQRMLRRSMLWIVPQRLAIFFFFLHIAEGGKTNETKNISF